MKRLVCIALAAIAPALAQAQEVTLRVVSAFAENTAYVKNLEGMIKGLNASGKGTLQLNFIGGPKAMPPFEVGNVKISALRPPARSTPPSCRKRMRSLRRCSARAGKNARST
jgi:hypothetical protein